MDKDYDNFVARMGSFEMDTSEFEGMEEKELTHFVKIVDSNELSHFGVPGMRWGHRKSNSESNVSDRKTKRDLKKKQREQTKADNKYEKLEKRYKGRTTGDIAANHALKAIGGVAVSNLVGSALYANGLTSLGPVIATYGSMAAVGAGVGGFVGDNNNKKKYESMRYERNHS